MKQDRKTVDARRMKILAVVRERQRITVEELSKQFGVSMMTIRRDLRILQELGKLGRFHGGASADILGSDISEPERSVVNACRAAISRYAASLVQSGEKIFINGSRTALNALNYVTAAPVTVVTNNGLAIGHHFPEGIEVAFTGGVIRNGGHIMTGDCAIRNLLNAAAAKAFIGCSGISPDGEILCDIPAELGINETMISHSRQYFVLADHTKIGKAGTYASFSLERLGGIITDEYASASVVERLRGLGMNVICVSKN